MQGLGWDIQKPKTSGDCDATLEELDQQAQRDAEMLAELLGGKRPTPKIEPELDNQEERFADYMTKQLFDLIGMRLPLPENWQERGRSLDEREALGYDAERWRKWQRELAQFEQRQTRKLQTQGERLTKHLRSELESYGVEFPKPKQTEEELGAEWLKNELEGYGVKFPPFVDRNDLRDDPTDYSNYHAPDLSDCGIEEPHAC